MTAKTIIPIAAVIVLTACSASEDQELREFLSRHDSHWTEIRCDIDTPGQDRPSGWEGGNKDENTAGMIAAISTPWVRIISHPGDGTAELNFEPIVLAAKEHQTLLEINSSSLNPHRGKEKAKANNLEILRLCKQYEVPVILGSDAHISYSIADYRFALPLLDETEFPEDLIMNDKPEWFLQYTGIDRRN